MACAERSLGRSEAPDSSEGLKGPDSGDRIAQALKASFKDLDAQILAEEQWRKGPLAVARLLLPWPWVM